MAKRWEQVGGDVNPKDYGAVIAVLDGDTVDVQRIDPNEEGPGWHVDSATFYLSDLEWDGSAKAPDIARTMGISKEEWEGMGPLARAAAAMQYHGSGWSGSSEIVTKWSHALPVKSNQIKWWK